MNRPDVVAILGPTASGKSPLGMAIAGAADGEIVCCDSMQIYRGLDIGTAKPTAAERAAQPHHLLDLVNPGENFSAASWADRARTTIADISQRGRLPILVGGTGLYYRALVRGLFEAPSADLGLRGRHQEEAARFGVPALHARLARVDPEAAAKISPNDLLRTSRALEVFEQTGVPISELRRRAPAPPEFRMFVVILDPPLPWLRTQIDARVDAMMETGFLGEVQELRARGLGDTRPLAGLGYLHLSQHLAGTASLKDAIAQTKLATGAYARRQRTWFRKEEAARRVAVPMDFAHLEEIRASVLQWRQTG